MDSNYSLRFPRTYREATGQDAHFERLNPYKIVFAVCAVLAAFLVGMMIGGVL